MASRGCGIRLWSHLGVLFYFSLLVIEQTAELGSGPEVSPVVLGAHLLPLFVPPQRQHHRVGRTRRSVS